MPVPSRHSSDLRWGPGRSRRQLSLTIAVGADTPVKAAGTHGRALTRWFMTFSKQNLGYKAPKTGAIVQEMPLSYVGKVLRRLVKENTGRTTNAV